VKGTILVHLRQGFNDVPYIRQKNVVNDIGSWSVIKEKVSGVIVTHAAG
jgi:hypothetical protein